MGYQWGAFLGALGHNDHRLGWLLSAGAVANLVDGIAKTAFPLLVATLTRDPVQIGALSATQFVPWLVFGLFSGTLVDRIDRRRAMLVANAGRAAVVFSTATGVYTGGMSIWLVLRGGAPARHRGNGRGERGERADPRRRGAGSAGKRQQQVPGDGDPVAVSVVLATARHALVPGELLGRVLGARRTVAWGLIPVGAVLGGALTRAFGGAGATFAVSGILQLALAGFTIVALRRFSLAAAPAP